MLNQVTFTGSYHKIDQMADAIADLHGDEATGNTVMSLAMCLARLLAPGKLSAEEEAKFITDVLDWAGAYLSVTKES